jgi:hypothetical protein
MGIVGQVGRTPEDLKETQVINKLALAVLLSVSVAPAALAQGAGSSSTGSSTQANQPNQGSQSLPQQIQQKLKDQGFSNVQVVPGSFLVSAKDKQGDPVTMVIGPQSMTVFTMHSASGSSTTTGSATGGSSGSGTGGSMNKSTSGDKK